MIKIQFSINKLWFLGFLFFAGLQYDVTFSLAQPVLKDFYEGTAQVSVKNDNYVVARKKAVDSAMKNAMKLVFKDLMGEEEFEANTNQLQKIIRRVS